MIKWLAFLIKYGKMFLKGKMYMGIKRTFEKQIRNAESKFVCITISGARQTGKSTMVRH